MLFWPCTGKKKTCADDMARQKIVVEKTKSLLSTCDSPVPQAKRPKKVTPSKDRAGHNVALALPDPVPPPKAGRPPLTPQMHTRLRATLADKRYLACPKADLPTARVHQTAQHESGMVHAADNYYGGEWYDGIEVRAIFFTNSAAQ